MPAGFRLPPDPPSHVLTPCLCGIPPALSPPETGPRDRRVGDGGHSPRLVWPKEKMQPSAPLTTDWSTSATVPAQTSAWGRNSQAGPGVTGPVTRLPPRPRVTGWPGRRTQTQDRALCTENTQTGHGCTRSMNRPDTRLPGTQGSQCHGEPRRDPDHSTCVVPAGTGHIQGQTHGSKSPRRGGCFPGKQPGAGPAAGEDPRGRGGRRQGTARAALRPPAPAGPPGSPAPRPGGRRRRRRTSSGPCWWPRAGGPRCLGARRPGRRGSPASSAGPPSGRPWTRPSAGPPGRARPAA